MSNIEVLQIKKFVSLDENCKIYKDAYNQSTNCYDINVTCG